MGIKWLEESPLTGLTAVFAAWKGFLLAVAFGAAIGPSYDTSTALYFDRVYGSNATILEPSVRLTRWDALYFMHAASVGKLYEQEWAFGWGLSVVVSTIREALRTAGFTESLPLEPLIAIAFAHLTHLLAVVTLYKLTVVLFQNRRLALVSAILHILSPAGLFLSSPYAESPFALLSMLGSLLFACGLQESHGVWRSLALISSGITFGISSLFRSNGIANGLLFAVQAVYALIGLTKKPSLAGIVDLGQTVLGGLCVAAGTVVPQYVAWNRYCSASAGVLEPPPWCSHLIPSIYTYVQEVYWNTGFLAYWTLNQAPLFVLAAPVLTLLMISGIRLVRDPFLHSKTPWTKQRQGQDSSRIIRSLAAMQLCVGLLAITSYHVQIITRLASAYPVWYWWIAGSILSKKDQSIGLIATSFMVMYAGIQGALFASFLPPA